ncbi:MAG TPA: hypothetical protein VNK49_03095 [Anaerolineales bacterium]|nr:hypothetical protein [Anaerolineales bacterium]
MNNIDVDVALLLGEEANRQVFNQILKNRKVQLRELIETGYSRERIKKVLTNLKKYNLIGEKASTFDEFNTYYITAEGLQIGRKISF